jgi:tetratricopeptide (TPR) repeat protein
LFVAFAERCDCPVQIMSTPRHVFCRLRADSLDIEPTCPDWFRASTKWDTDTAATDSRPTTLAPEIPGEITPVQLVARVYYNRGVALLEHRQFSSGTACLQASLQLDVHHAAARANLVAGLNNWALAECEASHFDRAVELVAQGQRLDPHFAPLAANDVHVHQQWVTHLCEKGEFSQAIELLDNAYRRRPDVVLFDLGRCTVSVAWSRSLIQSRRLREAASVVERGLACHPDSQDLHDLKQQLTRLGS